MILQALTAYYEAMLKKGIVAPPGWDGAFKTTNSAARKPCSPLSR